MVELDAAPVAGRGYKDGLLQRPRCHPPEEANEDGPAACSPKPTSEAQLKQAEDPGLSSHPEPMKIAARIFDGSARPNCLRPVGWRPKQVGQPRDEAQSGDQAQLESSPSKLMGLCRGALWSGPKPMHLKFLPWWRRPISVQQACLKSSSMLEAQLACCPFRRG